MTDLAALSLDPEACLLGAVLSGYSRIPLLNTIVEPIDFASPLHQALWSEILAAHSADMPIDPIVIKERFDSRYGYAKAPFPWPQDANGPVYLVDLMRACPLPFNAPYYAWMVADAASRRGLKSAARRIADLADSGLEPIEVADAAKRALEGAAVKARPPDLTTAGAAFERFVDESEKPQGPHFETPWPDLNRFVPELRPGMVVVIGATPSVGKSLVGTNLASALAADGARVLFATLEMSEHEVIARMIAAKCRIDLTKLLGRKLTDDLFAKMAGEAAYFTSLPLTIEQRPEQTVAYISARAAATEAQVVIVDYLQLVAAADKRAPRHEQVSQISRDLKLMARERNCVLVAAAQANREGAKKGKPSMSDLRESGAIENDADVVLMLHRDEQVAGELFVVVDKNRNGPKGEFSLAVAGHYASVSSIYIPRKQGK